MPSVAPRTSGSRRPPGSRSGASSAVTTRSSATASSRRSRRSCVDRAAGARRAAHRVGQVGRLLRRHRAAPRRRGAGPPSSSRPLLALMRDQIAAAERAGIRAVTINSTNAEEWGAGPRAARRRRGRRAAGQPRTAQQPPFRDEQLPALAAAAGCSSSTRRTASATGARLPPRLPAHPRPARRLPDATPVLATTATANAGSSPTSPSSSAPGGAHVLTLRGALARDSLRLGVLPSHVARAAACLADRAHLDDLPGSGIVYTLTVAAAEDVAAALREAGHEVAAYTGRTDPAERERLEEACATTRSRPSSPPRRSAWASTSPTSASWCTSARRLAGGVLPAGRSCRPCHRACRRAAPARPRDKTSGATSPRRPCPRGTGRRRLAGPAESGRPLSTAALESMVDVRRTRLELLLKVLDVDGAVHRVSGGWIATGEPWTYDAERYGRVAEAREREQQLMVDYEQHRPLPHGVPAALLDDDTAAPCGRCDNCAGPWFAADVADAASTRPGATRPGRGRLEPRRSGPPAWTGWACRSRAGLADELREAAPSRVSPTSGGASGCASCCAARTGPRFRPPRWSRACVHVLAGWGWEERPVGLVSMPSRRRRSWSARWRRPGRAGAASVSRRARPRRGRSAGSPAATAPSGSPASGIGSQWDPSWPRRLRPPGSGAARRRPVSVPVDAHRGRAGNTPSRCDRRASLRARRRRLTILEGRPARHTGAIAAEPSRCGFAWRTLAHELHAKFMNSASLVRMTTEILQVRDVPAAGRRGLAGAGWVSEHVAVELSPGADSRRRVAPDDGRGPRTDRRPSQCRGHQCGHPVVHRRGPLVDDRRRRLHSVAAATKPSRR